MTVKNRVMSVAVAAAVLVGTPAMAAQAQAPASVEGLDYAYCTTYKNGDKFGASCYGTPGVKITVKAKCTDRKGRTYEASGSGNMGMGQGTANGSCRQSNHKASDVTWSWSWGW